MLDDGNVQLTAAIPNFLILENVPDWHNPSWTGELLTHPPLFEKGYLQVSDRPGVGTDINEEVLQDLLKRYPAQPSFGTR